MQQSHEPLIIRISDRGQAKGIRVPVKRGVHALAGLLGLRGVNHRLAHQRSLHPSIFLMFKLFFYILRAAKLSRYVLHSRWNRKLRLGWDGVLLYLDDWCQEFPLLFGSA